MDAGYAIIAIFIIDRLFTFKNISVKTFKFGPVMFGYESADECWYYSDKTNNKCRMYFSIQTTTDDSGDNSFHQIIIGGQIFSVAWLGWKYAFTNKSGT